MVFGFYLRIVLIEKKVALIKRLDPKNTSRGLLVFAGKIKAPIKPVAKTKAHPHDGNIVNASCNNKLIISSIIFIFPPAQKSIFMLFIRTLF